MDKRTFLITGATGYIASRIIKQLLEQGHKVNGTVRNLKNSNKYQYLLDLNNSLPGDLKLYEADLLNKGSFAEAMEGVEFVLHTASPFVTGKIKDAHKQLIEPALEGTRNVLNSVNETPSVKRVVLTSSVVAIYGDAIDMEKTANGVFTEEYWNETSDEKHQPYAYSKLLAEKEAWKINNAQDRWDLNVINPAFVLGPSLGGQKDSASVSFMTDMVNGKFGTGAPPLTFGVVDVRDVAKAHINAALLPKASGRHIACSGSASMLEISQMIKSAYPNIKKLPKSQLPKFLLYLVGPMNGFSWKFVSRNVGRDVRFDNSYIKKDLEMDLIPVEQTIKDHVAQLTS